MNFVNLHGHSTMSFLDGYGTPKQIAARIKDLGQTAAALTDHGNIIGHVQYQKAFKDEGIKPIFGCEFYVVEDMEARTRHNKSLGVDGYAHLTVLAMNQKGYENLIGLHNAAWSRGFYIRPRVDWKEVEAHQEGLMVLSGCVGGWPSRLIELKGPEEAWRFIAERRQKIEHYYVELIPVPGLGISHSATTNLVKIATDLRIPMVITSDAHFPKPEDHRAQDLMCCVGQRKRLDQERQVRLEPFMYYGTRDELLNRAMQCVAYDGFDTEWWWQQFNVAADNSVVLASLCNVEIPKAKPMVFPGVANSADQLWLQITEGAKYRFDTGQIPKHLEQQYFERAAHEFQIIRSKGFCDYLLALTDIVLWAKAQNSLVMCRGSAGGCLILYLTGCSETDSIRHELSFERFYDDSRPDPPDIDVDFEQSMRPRVIEYITNKYGQDKSCQIISLGLLRTKQAIIDAAYAFGIPQHEITPLTTMLDSKNDDVDIQLDGLKDRAALAVLEKHPELRIANKMVGQCRQQGIHAAGMIVSPESLSLVIGVMKQPNKPVVSTVDKHGAAELGYLKMDLLSVSAFDVVARAVRTIGKKIEWLYTLPLGDKRDREAGETGHIDVYNMAKSMKVAGVFQLDGAAITVAKAIGLDTFEEFYAASALCRPGAQEFVSLYANNKHKIDDFIAYLQSHHPLAAQIVKDTYGVLLYQEQVMRMCREMSLFDWIYVHKLRKRIAASSFHGKPLEESHKINFVNGCVSNGIPASEAEHWWEAIRLHGVYSFNKSHCVTYGIIGYWMLYLKTHYPSAYYEAFMACEGEASTPNTLLMKRLIGEFREWGGQMVILDPTYSRETFSCIDERTMVGGWSNIKGIGPALAKTIVNNGPYSCWAEVQEVMYKNRGRAIFNKILAAGICGDRPLDVQAVVELASWYPTLSTGKIETKWRNMYCPMRPGYLSEIPYSINDTYVAGYVTAAYKKSRTGSFKGDQIIYVIEDETGQVTARVSNKNLGTIGVTIKAGMKLGDYVLAHGWYSGDKTLFMDNIYNVSRDTEMLERISNG